MGQPCSVPEKVLGPRAPGNRGSDSRVDVPSRVYAHARRWHAHNFVRANPRHAHPPQKGSPNLGRGEILPPRGVRSDECCGLHRRAFTVEKYNFQPSAPNGKREVPTEAPSTRVQDPPDDLLHFPTGPPVWSSDAARGRRTTIPDRPPHRCRIGSAPEHTGRPLRRGLGPRHRGTWQVRGSQEMLPDCRHRLRAPGAPSRMQRVPHRRVTSCDSPSGFGLPGHPPGGGRPVP